MKINKIEILKELNESNIDNCTFINIVNFSDEVILDVNISKPTFQDKKNAELTINKFFLLIFAFISITLVWYISSQTLLGKRIYAVGSNPEGAISRGLSFNRITILVFVFLGVLAGVGGVLYTARYATINPADVGRGLEFDVISAVVIGGTNIFGGSGTALGTALGCLLIGILSNGLTVVGVSPFWKACATGFLILLAVTVDNVVRRKQEQKFLLAIRNQESSK